MAKDSFDEIEQKIKSVGLEEGFDYLIQRFCKEKKYPLIFQARLMKKRHELGLGLIQLDSSSDIPEESQSTYNQTQLEAAREVGTLFLTDGQIEQAWPYFRAIGDAKPVADAIEAMKPKEDMAAIIEIALYERVNPRRGFELLLESYGTCRAITGIQQYPVQEGRTDCIQLLVRTLHGELLDNLKQAITKKEGEQPKTNNVTELIENRDWLFGKYSYYVDSSHLLSIVQLSLDLTDEKTLELALQLAEYGAHLSSEFQYKGTPPLDNYLDFAFYLRSLLGQEVDKAIEHFQQKIPKGDPSEVDSNPAQVLVKLLARIQRYPEAIDISLEYLNKVDPEHLTCPTVYQLCQLGHDYDRLKEFSRNNGDVLNFVAGVLQQ